MPVAIGRQIRTPPPERDTDDTRCSGADHQKPKQAATDAATSARDSRIDGVRRGAHKRGNLALKAFIPRQPSRNMFRVGAANILVHPPSRLVRVSSGPAHLAVRKGFAHHRRDESAQGRGLRNPAGLFFELSIPFHPRPPVRDGATRPVLTFMSQRCAELPQAAVKGDHLLRRHRRERRRHIRGHHERAERMRGTRHIVRLGAVPPPAIRCNPRAFRVELRNLVGMDVWVAGDERSPWRASGAESPNDRSVMTTTRRRETGWNLGAVRTPEEAS